MQANLLRTEPYGSMTQLMPTRRPLLTGLSAELQALVAQHSRRLGVEPVATPDGLLVAAQTRVTVETLRRSGSEAAWIDVFRRFVTLLEQT